MSALNNITVQGRLGQDPELRYTNSGKAVCSVSIFLENSYPTKDNPGGWIEIVAFEQRAEFMAKYFNKGDKIIVCGSLKCDNYVNKEGKSVTKWSIVANNIHFCGDRASDQNSSAQNAQSNNSNNYNRPNQNSQPQRNQQNKQQNYSNDNSYGGGDSSYGGSGFNGMDDEIPF